MPRIEPAGRAVVRNSLHRVLADLGGTVLQLCHGDLASAPPVGGVAIHDPIDEDPAFPPNALVLAVGVREIEDVHSLLAGLAGRAAAVVLREPVAAVTGFAKAADQAGVVVLGLARGASWAQLTTMLRILLADGDMGPAEPESLGGLPSGDLFALANAIAALLDAPITIEDRNSMVLAFSGRQDEADPSRVETILGREVPERYRRILIERGVFHDLQRNEGPVLVEPVPLGDGRSSLPRVAIGVRAGEETLGSIWAAVRDPLRAERIAALSEAAKLVALHMLRMRAGADVERRLRTELVATALAGGSAASEALSRLGLARQPITVFALSSIEPSSQAPTVAVEAAAAGERQRLADAFGMHLAASHPRSTAAVVADVVYGLLPLSRSDEVAEHTSVRIAADFLDRVGPKTTAVIGVGAVAPDVAGLAYARGCADRALRVLCDGGRGQRAARLADVHLESLMIELRDLVSARGDPPSGAVARLLAYDYEHGTNLVTTLQAWLDSFGDVGAAAAAVHVHPNTFRYRLRRLSEVGQLDLGNAEDRFMAMIQLRMAPHRPAS